jgi:phage-related protein
MKEVSGGVGNLGNVALKVGGVLAGVFAVEKIVGFGKEILTQAGNFEQYQNAFEVLLGSVEKAKVLMGDLAEFAKKTPFRLEEVVTGSKQLLAYGFAQEDIIKNMKMLGNVSSALKIPLGDLVYLYGTTATQGKAMTKDLYQFMNRGIPIVDMLAERFGVTKDKIFDMASESRIGFKDIEVAMNSLGGEQGKWADLMDKQSETMLGKLSNLQDAWQQFTVTLGNIFLPVATQVIQFLTDLIIKTQELFGNTGELNNIWQELQMVWTNVLMWLQPLIAWFVSTVIPMLQSVWNEIWYFINTVVPPLVAIVNWLINVVLMPLITMFVNFWKDKWEFVILILKGAWDMIVGIVQLGWSIVAGLFTTFLLLITGQWTQAWENIKYYAGIAWNGIKNILNGAVEFIKGWGGWLFDELTAPFRRAWDTIQDIVNKIKGALDFTKRHSPSVIDIIDRSVGLANKAFEGLKVGIEPINTSSLSLAGVGTGVNPVINIDLSGAYVSDESIGEKIGDAIISKLQKNVRF